MRLCGISSRFQLLSPRIRQVTHALLTRPPLTCFKNRPKLLQRNKSVRLACVKHAASVHPEPGSNSHVKRFVLPVLTGITVFRLLLILLRAVLLNYFFKEIFRVALLFDCQSSLFSLFSFLSDNSDIISSCAVFVNNFFKKFFHRKASVFAVELQYII